MLCAMGSAQCVLQGMSGVCTAPRPCCNCRPDIRPRPEDKERAAKIKTREKWDSEERVEGRGEELEGGCGKARQAAE